MSNSHKFKCHFCGEGMLVRSLINSNDSANCPSCGAIADRGASGPWLTLSGDKSQMSIWKPDEVSFFASFSRFPAESFR